MELILTDYSQNVKAIVLKLLKKLVLFGPTVSNLSCCCSTTRVQISSNGFCYPRNHDYQSTNLDELFARLPSCDQSKVSREYAQYAYDQIMDNVIHHCNGNLVELRKHLTMKVTLNLNCSRKRMF